LVKKSIVAAAVAAVWVLAACSGATGGDGSPSADASTGGAAAQAIDPNRQPPAAPIDGAVAGGTVTVMTGIKYVPAATAPTTLDPTAAALPDTISILRGLVTRSLTQYVYDPAQQGMVLVPDIATDLGTPNEDFTEWTFTIRHGVRFENGTEVTADDVAYGIERSFDRQAFPNGARYSNDYFLDGDTYKGPLVDSSGYDGVVVDGDTLTIKMARPFPDMPYWAAFPAMGPIPEQDSDPATYGHHPLATGPYKFDEFLPGKSLTLVRNQSWDPDTDPGRHAYPDRYVFKFNPNDTTVQNIKRIDATILGASEAAQTTLTLDDVLPGDYSRAQELHRLTIGPYPRTSMCFPDYRKIPEIKVRRAIGYAFPYDDFAKAFGYIFGVTELPGTSILPPGFPGRQDYNPLDTEPGRTDPDKAKALLDEAGFAPSEYQLKWYYDRTDSAWVAASSVLVKALEAAGFKATAIPSSYEQVQTVNNDPQAPVNLRFVGWVSDWPSGSSWFQLLFHSEGGYNDAYFDQPTVDAAIERIGRLPFDEQPAEWGALDQMIMTKYYPAVITGYPSSALLHGSKIGGMNNDDTSGTPTWKDIYVVE
jgi:peptide/nickel transport system substrate-binding protein